jgi:hypothetical protein
MGAAATIFFHSSDVKSALPGIAIASLFEYCFSNIARAEQTGATPNQWVDQLAKLNNTSSAARRPLSTAPFI